MKWLAQNLNLSISVEEDPEYIVLSLASASSHGSVIHRQEVGSNTTNRAYHRKEALVIGVRHLMSKAVDQNLISVSLGAWKISNTGTSSPESTMSSTEWGF
jgi:hypothetical protein